MTQLPTVGETGNAGPGLTSFRKHLGLRGVGLGSIHERRYFTTVYRARAGRRATVAVKLVHHDEPNIKRRFCREIRILEAIREHPGFPEIWIHGMFRGQPYLVTEWVDGVSMQQLLSCGEFLEDVSQRLRWVRDSAALVEFLHARGIVHRDVAVDHLFVTPTQGQIRLIDFGMAEWLDEQHTKDAHGYRQYDVLALGLVLVELLLGRLCFSYRHPALKKQIPNAIALVQRRRLPEGTYELIQRALSADSEMKLSFDSPFRPYRSVRSFRRDLEKILVRSTSVAKDHNVKSEL